MIPSRFWLCSSVAVLAIATSACHKDRAEPLRAEPSASGGTVVPVVSAAPPEKPKEPPTLVPQVTIPADPPGVAVRESGKEILVLAKSRVGRVVGDEVEWFHTYEPGPSGAFGRRMLNDVYGTYPDGLFGYLVFENGRAPVPTIAPLTGKGGQEASFAPGGGWGSFNGIAQVGDSVVVHGDDMYEGPRIVTVRGPRVERFVIPAGSQGCEEVGFGFKGAVRVGAFGGAKNGMLVAAGDYCKDEKVTAVEIWPPGESKPKLVKVERKRGDFLFRTLPSGDDGLFVAPYSKGTILEVRGDQVTQLPETPGDIQAVFLHPDGALGVATDDAIVKLDKGAWLTEARLPFGTRIYSVARRDDTYWVSTIGGVGKLVPGKSTSDTPECKTPFVFLYDVSWKAEPTYTFPTTRKALQSFSDRSKLKLVEIDMGQRRLGLVVPDRAVGEAVIAHVKANMKDENPKLLCVEPRITREIAIDQKP